MSARSLTSQRFSVPPFGVYRLAIPEWQMYAYKTLVSTEQSSYHYLRSQHVPYKHANRFEIKSTFATTFVECCDMRDRTDRNDIQFGKVLERIGNLAADTEIVAIPIEALAWKFSHIVAPFNQRSAEYRNLLGQQDSIKRILHEAGVEAPRLKDIHHTSLSGFRNGVIPMSRLLNQEHYDKLLQMMSSRLKAAGIDSVELGYTTVSSSYIDQYTLENWALNGCALPGTYEGQVAV